MLTCLPIAPCAPHRFTDKWKNRFRHPSVPPEALPPALKRKFEQAEVDKRRYQRASSMARSPSMAEWEGKVRGAASASIAKVAPSK